MSFDGIKKNLVNKLGELGYKESKESFNVDNMSPHEYGKTFVINMLSGIQGENSENINTRLYDDQVWRIQIAFEKSEHNDVIVRDKMYRAIEALIKKIDNPDNWENVTNGPRMQKYQSWDVEDLDSYKILTILIQITDTYNY